MELSLKPCKATSYPERSPGLSDTHSEFEIEVTNHFLNRNVHTVCQQTNVFVGNPAVIEELVATRCVSASIESPPLANS